MNSFIKCVKELMINCNCSLMASSSRNYLKEEIQESIWENYSIKNPENLIDIRNNKIQKKTNKKYTKRFHSTNKLDTKLSKLPFSLIFFQLLFIFIHAGINNYFFLNFINFR